jgi:hypothetical protein
MFDATAIHASCSPLAYLQKTFTVASSTLARKISSISSISLATGNSDKGRDIFDTGISPPSTSPKPKLVYRGKSPHAIYSSMASRPPIERVALTKATSPASSSPHSNGGSIAKSNAVI